MSGIRSVKVIVSGCFFCLIGYAMQLFPAAGDLVFKFQTEGPIFSSPAVASDGTIYVGSEDHNLYAVNPDGTLNWQFTTNGPIKSSPAINWDGRIYVGSEDSSLYSVNSDGTENWIYNTGSSITASPAIGGNGNIYLGSGARFNTYINKDGPITDPWKQLVNATYLADGNMDFSSVAIVSDLTVYVGIGDKLNAFLTHLSLSWQRLEGSPVQSSPAVDANGNIYIGSFNNNLYAFSSNSEQKWSFQTGGPIFSSPAIGPDLTLYVGSQDYTLYAITLDGTLKWLFTTEGPINSSPAVGSDGTIYVGSEDYNLYAITSEGALKWKYITGGPVNSSPAVENDGTVYFGSEDGYLYAIDSGTEAGLADSPWPKFRHDLQNTGLIQLSVIGNFVYEINSGGGDYGLIPGTTGWYNTQGNNLEVILHTSGQHRNWDLQTAIIWPRGSGEKMMAWPGLWYGGVGHFSLDEKMDTTIQRHNDGAHDPGRIPTNFWWRENGLYYVAQQDLDGDGGMDLPQGSLKLKVSTRAGDLDAWPPEFRTDVNGDGKGDINGEPIVISDEDVICIQHPDWNVRGQIGGLNLNEFFEGYGPPLPVQFEERIMSFNYPGVRDIQFHLVTCRNMSRWHFYAWNGDPSRGPVTPPGVPYLLPTDINHMMIGQYAALRGESGGWDGPNYVGYIPSIRLLFGLDRDFVSAGYNDQVGFMGMVFLHTPEVNGEEIPITVASTERTGMPYDGGVHAGWTLWASDRMKTDDAWNMFRGKLYLERQGPGPNPGNVADPRSDSSVYLSSWEGDLFQGMAQSDELILPPDSAVKFDFAWLCAYPVHNPVPDNSDEGVAIEAGNLINLASSAIEIYGNGFIHPGTPLPPNATLMPGDRQVTITWDDISETSRDEMYDYYAGSNDYREYDFQGYRLYRSKTGRAGDAELLAEFDLSAGLQYSFTDTGLENCFPYYYLVTAYDWNALNTDDVSTVFSRESPVVFGPDNRVIPSSNPDGYRRQLITDEAEDLVMIDGSGDSLNIGYRDIQVEDYRLIDGATPTNALRNPFIFIQDAGQTYETYYIVIDSIIGEPDETENPAVVPDYDYLLMNRVYVSLTDKLGKVLFSDSKMIKCEWAAYPGHGARFFLYPPKDDVGVPFNLEFELLPYNLDLSVWNNVDIITGTTPLEDVELLQGYNGGNNSVPIGYRAADIELRWHEVGDSLTLEVWDLTHNVEIPYNRMPGSSWSFYKSWSRFIRLSGKMRAELTESDFSGAGSNPKAPRTPSRTGSDVKFYLFLCGMQLKVSTPQETVPGQGDVWLIRTNYGNYPDGGSGLLNLTDYFGDPLIRPPVTGVRYQVRTGGSGEPPSKSCDFSGDGKILINDVITFLLMARDNPNDPRVDWNEDGKYVISDAILLLLDIMNGTCPDASGLLAANRVPAPIPPMVHSLSTEDIEYLERVMSQMNLTSEQEAALRLALYGKTGAARMPEVFSLSQNSPNPFNPSTAICYTVPEGRTVEVVLKVYDIRGALVRTLVEEVKEAGRYFVFWDGTDNKGSLASSGVYFYRIQTEEFMQTRKMVLLK